MTGRNGRPYAFWGIGQRWIDAARERWGDLPDHELARRARILKEVDRIERSTTLDPSAKAHRIGGLMASASRTPREASRKGVIAQDGQWLRRAKEDFPDASPEEQARRAKVLKEIRDVRLQVASLKARHRRKRRKSDEDVQKHKALVAKLRARLGGLTMSLRGDAGARAEKAREGNRAKLRQQAIEEDPNRTPEEIDRRVKELMSLWGKRMSDIRRDRRSEDQ